MAGRARRRAACDERRLACRRRFADEKFLRPAREGPGIQRGQRLDRAHDARRMRYSARESWPRFQEEALEALRALPGVADAGITSILPFTSMSDQG